MKEIILYPSFSTIIHLYPVYTSGSISRQISGIFLIAAHKDRSSRLILTSLIIFSSWKSMMKIITLMLSRKKLILHGCVPNKHPPNLNLSAKRCWLSSVLSPEDGKRFLKQLKVVGVKLARFFAAHPHLKQPGRGPL